MKIAILAHIFYSDLAQEIFSYIDRLPYDYDLYFTTQDDSLADDILAKSPTAQRVECPNDGMDIGAFFHKLNHIQKLGVKYDYYLKIHTKREDLWRRSMFEACLPYKGYDRIFSMIDEYHILGSNKYLFNMSSSHANKDIILKQIEKHKLAISESDIYDTIKPFSPENESLDEHFYNEYHCDLRVHHLPSKVYGEDIAQRCRDHWNRHGKHEDGRIPNYRLIESFADEKYKFYAGTVFWFDNEYLEHLMKHVDSFDEMVENFSCESGRLINDSATYTHHLEYWFGLIGSYLSEKELTGMTTVNFLMPEISKQSVSGGLRNLFQMIDYFEKNNFLINIQVFGHLHWGDDVKDSLWRINNFNEIDNVIKNINLMFGKDGTDCYSDVFVVTGWQTFEKGLHYQKMGMLGCFFCQDLEYMFDQVKGTHAEESVWNFYDTLSLPTITITQFLGNKLDNGKRRLVSMFFGVDDEVYFDKGLNERNGICLLHVPATWKRLPSLVREVASRLKVKYPDKPILLYGCENCHKGACAGYECLGLLSTEGTADLYSKMEVGVCFSATNPSRVGFEMLSCGLPCVEAKNEFTEFDLTADAFVCVEANVESVLNGIDEILNNMDKYRSACVSFDDNAKDVFLEFVKEHVLEESKCVI